MATETAIDTLARAHEDLVSIYTRLAERTDDGASLPFPDELSAMDEASGAADHYALLKIAQVLADVGPIGEDGLLSPDLIDGLESTTARRRLEALRASLSDGAVSMSDDPLGRLYEATRQRADRRAYGQFYTPMSVANLAAEWAVDHGHDSLRVLDPGAGSGSFLVAARDALTYREQPDSRLVGVDVKRLPLELARLRLEPGITEPGVRAINCSFFDLEPGAPPPPDTVLGDGVQPDLSRLGSFDAVIGNPPFVRGEALAADEAHYRSHLAAFGPASDTPYLEGEYAIDRRSDAYVYFLTHATQFLRAGGRLAFVLPTKWLMSGYGEGLQRFLLDHYAIRGVIGLGAAFDDALVDTCLLLATRRHQEAERQANRIRFVRELPPSGPPLRDLLEPPTDTEIDAVSRPQADLSTGKWDRFLAAPDWLLALEEYAGVVSLDTVAAVSRGVMTGANDFFFVDQDDRDRWEIDSQFLKPAVKSLREVDSPVYRRDDVDRWMVDVHGYRSRFPEESSEEAVTTALEHDGYDGLLAYIDHAEAAGWHEGRTCRQRPVWFDLGELPAPDAFMPKLLRERRFVIRNDADATPSNAIDCLVSDPTVDPGALVAVLNSSLARAFMEVRGRNEAGMLQLMTYETAGLPIPDPRRFNGTDRDDLLDAFDTLARGEAGAQEHLDRIVHTTADIDADPAAVRSVADRLRQRRLDS